jgi:hypothetical protein
VLAKFALTVNVLKKDRAVLLIQGVVMADIALMVNVSDVNTKEMNERQFKLPIE